MKTYIENFKKYRFLLVELVKKGIKLKYRRSYLGILWTLLEPLLTMIVLTIVFGSMFGNPDPTFPVYILTGRLLYSFFSSATSGAMKSIRGNAGMIKKVYVPKYIFTLSKVTSSLIDLIFSMGALILVMLITRAPFSPYLLLFPLVVIPLYIFVCGMGFFLSAANVFFRDIQYIYNAITVAWMYVTPMFYPIDLLPDWLRTLVEYCNPMYYYIQFFRDLVLYRHFTTPRIFVGCWLMAFVMLAIGMAVFKKTQDKFILYI